MTTRGILSALSAVLLLAGCSTTGTKDFDDSKVSQIKKGETTEQDLISMFGPAQSRSVDSEGQVRMNWMYGEYHMNAVSFIPIAGGLMTGGKGRTKSLSVILADGKVKDYTFTGSGEDAGKAPPPAQTTQKSETP